MGGINPLILKKIDSIKINSIDISKEEREIIKQLLNAEYIKQQRREKNYVDDYDDILSKGIDLDDDKY